MKTKVVKNNAPGQTTTSEPEAISKVPSENKNVSVSAKPFQHPEDCGTKDVPLLWPISDAVLRNPDPVALGAVPNINKMPEEDRAFYDGALKSIRFDCQKLLKFLIRFDSGISIEDSRTLCEAVRAIDRAVIVA